MIKQSVKTSLFSKNIILISSPKKAHVFPCAGFNVFCERQRGELMRNFDKIVKDVANLKWSTVNVGEIEGMHYTEIQEKFGEKYRQWRSSDNRYENIRFAGGESKKEVRERVFAGLTDYALHSSHSVIAVSSHGIMLSQVLLTLGLEACDIPNGAVVCLAYRDGNWQFKGFI